MRHSKASISRFFSKLLEDYAYDSGWDVQKSWIYWFDRWQYNVGSLIPSKIILLIYQGLFEFVQIITIVELPCELPVDRSLIIENIDRIVRSGVARFPENCRLCGGIIAGLRRINEECAPVVGNKVYIDFGTKLLDPNRIGDNVLIGTNVLVPCDVSDNSVAIGVPA